MNVCSLLLHLLVYYGLAYGSFLLNLVHIENRQLFTFFPILLLLYIWIFAKN